MGFYFSGFYFSIYHKSRKSSYKALKKIKWLFIPFSYSAVIHIFYDLDAVMHLFKIPDTIKALIETLKGLEFYIVYLFIPFITIYTHRFIRFSRDNHEKRWITFLWFQVFVLLLSWLISVLIGLFFEYDISLSMEALALFSTILIHYTTYYGVFKYRLANDKEGILALLYSNIPSCSNNLLTDITHEKETEGNNLESITKDNPYFKKLEALCEEHHIYRDSTLNREKVAEKLGISAGYVSQLINIITEDNFANYINNYRVEAVKKMILDSRYENYSLLAIGLESGFTSKTTFHNAFKKATGMTPNTYRNTNK